MLSISAVLPGFPQTRAPWPVWRGSVAGPVRFAAMSRKAAAKLWHKARRWDRDTRQPGRHGGVIGRTALGTLYVLLFDFLNHRTGRLDPSLDAIAHKAGCCRRAVVDALARLRDLGLLHWQRRCEETRDAEGRFRLRQRTNAYGLLPPSQWRGYRDTDPPPPDPATLGAPEPIPDPIEAAVAEITQRPAQGGCGGIGGRPARQIGDGARRARAGDGRNLTECICCQETLPRIFTDSGNRRFGLRGRPDNALNGTDRAGGSTRMHLNWPNGAILLLSPEPLGRFDQRRAVFPQLGNQFRQRVALLLAGAVCRRA